MQTREDRIFRHANALAASVCCRKHWRGMAAEVWMPLARHWKMSIKELKEIVAAEKQRRKEARDASISH